MINSTLAFLGYPVRDKVTGFKGIAVSASFDLYGCEQIWIHPGLDKDGKVADGHWFDASRIEMTEAKRVMENPFEFNPRIERQMPAAVAAGPEIKTAPTGV